MKDPENLAEHLRLSFELVATLADGILARFDATGAQLADLRSMVDDFKSRAIPVQYRVLERLERIESEVASIKEEILNGEESEPEA
jgi:hypothetical protein